MSRCERTAALAPRRRHGRIDDDRLTLRTRAIVARRYRKEERENEEFLDELFDALPESGGTEEDMEKELFGELFGSPHSEPDDMFEPGAGETETNEQYKKDKKQKNKK